jgi:hypothetical protein
MHRDVIITSPLRQLAARNTLGMSRCRAVFRSSANLVDADRQHGFLGRSGGMGVRTLRNKAIMATSIE